MRVCSTLLTPLGFSGVCAELPLASAFRTIKGQCTCLPSSSSGTASHWIRAKSRRITRQAMPILEVAAAPVKTSDALESSSWKAGSPPPRPAHALKLRKAAGAESGSGRWLHTKGETQVWVVVQDPRAGDGYLSLIRFSELHL